MTMSLPSERPPAPTIDTTKPSIARAYDYALGGKNNYEVDRELVRQLDAVVPEVALIAIANRAFLIRAVRFLANQAGMDQYLDCGSGLPTAENTHQVAQRLNPDARVVYVDNDPVVLAYGRALLEENENTHFLDANIFEPSQVLESDVVNEHLDLTRPLGLLQIATLHHHSADFGMAPADVMQNYIDALPSGSYVVFSHFLDPEDENSVHAHRVQSIVAQSMDGAYFRKRSEIMEMIKGLDLVEPGLVIADEWWADGPHLEPLPPIAHCIVACVGRKP